VHKSNRIYLFLALLIWLGACEFKLPTTPSLPSKWNSKLILPLIDKSYSFANLVEARTGNPISADTTGVLQLIAVDSTTTPIAVDPESFWIVPAKEILQTLDLKKKIQRNADSTVNAIRYNMTTLWNDANNRIAFGILDNMTGMTTGGQPINALVLTAQLTDSFPCPIRIRLTAQNFHKNPGSIVVLDSLDLPADSLLNSVTIGLEGDSLIGGSLTEEIDSLTFGIEIAVLEKLPVAVSKLKQKLTTTVTVGQLRMDSFYGRVFANGEAPPSLINKSLTGASDIEFDRALAAITITDADGAYDSIYVQLRGRKVHGAATSIDTSIAMNAANFSMNASQVMSNLPDTIRILVKALSLPGAFQQSSVFASGVDVKYRLTVPLTFILPAEITLASGQTTTYFIKDSTTRANVITSQNGAHLDLSVENRTQLRGWLYFLISNFNFFPFDTLGDNLTADFISVNDTIWHLGDDTAMVQIDTLAVLEFPAAQFSGDTLIAAGIENQTFFAESTAVDLLADTCYFKPYFQLINPDTTSTTITESQSIRVKGYLNLYFDAGILNDDE